MLRPLPGINWRFGLTLGILTGLMALAIWLSVSASASLMQMRQSLSATFAVVFASDDLFGLLFDLESNQHGYLLTQRAAYLDPYRQAAGEVAPALRKLRAVTAVYPTYKPLTDELERLVPIKIQEMSRALQLAEQGDLPSARAMIDSGIGKNSMAAIRELHGNIQAAAIVEHARTLEEADQHRSQQRLSSIAIGILSLLLAFVAIFSLLRVNRGLREEVDRRRSAEASLRDLEERNRAYFEHSGDFLYIVEQRADGEWCYKQINPMMERLLDMSEDEARGRPIAEIIGANPAAVSVANFRRCQDSRAGVRFTNRAQFDSGIFDFDVSLTPLSDTDGAVRRVLGSARDVTQAKLTETALAQSLKMEAVGQLTGGIAHDFNNLLQVMIGNLELAGKTTGDAGVKQRLAAAMSAATMGQQLTRKLLTFARRAPTVVKVLDVAAIFKDLEPIVRVSLGEAIDLQLAMSEGLWRIEADRASLESAILNLAINARDAMPGGGALKIELVNVMVSEAIAAGHADAHPGEHVRITVADTGTGIAPELLSKVFVPFFTTKAAGLGTGLGLATVYALVRDRGGFVDIESRHGAGTSVVLYFPRSDGILADSEAPAAPSAGGNEAILVVEDDRQLLETTAETLRGLAYAVETAQGADAALEILATGRPFDLLLTDVVMPGPFNGVALAKRAQGTRPGLRILFMSGYIDDPAVHAAAASGNLQVLEKPFRSEQLAVAVRAALDRGARAGFIQAGGGRLDFRPAETGRSVLVVEDNDLVRAVAVDVLTVAGFRCIEAGNAAEALRCLRDMAIGIDVMVTDLHLPDQPGETLVREAGTLRPSMPVIISTGTSVSDTDPIVQPRAGVSFLQKPYAPELLVRRVTDATR